VQFAVEPSSWDTQPWVYLYAEAKQWQTGIAALLGFGGLIGAALFNFWLNRRRDARLRREEMISVASALYGEILLLRDELAQLARAVANYEINGRALRDVDQFSYAPSIPLLYPALAPKLGLLPSELLLGITKFYANVEGARRGLETYYRTQDDSPHYLSDVVLVDAVAGVDDVKPVLRTIEQLASIPEAKDPSTGDADGLLEAQRLQSEWAKLPKEQKLAD
jgi:hypothetical protein